MTIGFGQPSPKQVSERVENPLAYSISHKAKTSKITTVMSLSDNTLQMEIKTNESPCNFIC